MGEAKRRKQLGLMPTVIPFEAEIDRAGQVRLTRPPADPKLARDVQEKLEQTQQRLEGWDSEYRTALVLAGQVSQRLSTVQDVQRLPVPEYRRISGEVVQGKQAREIEGVALPIAGGALRLRDQQHSFDGQKWESFPQIRNPQRIFQALQTHPAFNLEGEKLGQYQVEQFAEGRIDVDPEPPAGTLEILEEVGREWHGETPELWAQLHADQLNGQAESDEIPVAKRTFFELRQPSPLQNPLRNIFGVRGGVEIYPLVDAGYSLDGEKWFKYEDPDAEPMEDDFFQAFSEMLNMETVQVTVYANGQTEWDDAELPEEHRQRVRREIVEATGAGDPEKWAAWTREMLVDTFNATPDENSDGSEIPVPQGVRLDLPKDALDDPDHLSQTFIESEVTFDGENWRDLYDEEVPQELLLAIAQMKPGES